jgi:hypothetical protein
VFYDQYRAGEHIIGSVDSSKRGGRKMMRFELHMVHDQMNIGDAIEEMIESRKSGLLVQTRARDLRIVDFNRSVLAFESGLKTLQEVEFEPVLDMETIQHPNDDVFVLNTLSGAGRAIGFLGGKSGVAQLFSVSETRGDPYAAVSVGVKCDRPGRPPSTPPRNWHHYYPPNTRDLIDPNQCRFCIGRLR